MLSAKLKKKLYFLEDTLKRSILLRELRAI
jgi:hypothetical protein